MYCKICGAAANPTNLTSTADASSTLCEACQEKKKTQDAITSCHDDNDVQEGLPPSYSISPPPQSYPIPQHPSELPPPMYTEEHELHPTMAAAAPPVQAYDVPYAHAVQVSAHPCIWQNPPVPNEVQSVVTNDGGSVVGMGLVRRGSTHQLVFKRAADLKAGLTIPMDLTVSWKEGRKQRKSFPPLDSFASCTPTTGTPWLTHRIFSPPPPSFRARMMV